MEGILAFLAVVRSRGSGPFCGRQLPGLAPPISLDSRLARSWGTVTGWEFEATGGRTGREELPDLVKRDFSAEGPTIGRRVVGRVTAPHIHTPSMGLAVKTHLPHTPSAHFLTAGVRMVGIAGSTTQGGEGCAHTVRIAVRKTFTAVAFSAPEREPSFYLGLCGPSLRSALQGCIAFGWGLGLSAPAHGVYGCSPL